MSAVARGNLKQRPLGRFMWALACQQFTGQLILNAKGREYTVRFNRGQITDAQSPELTDSLAKVAATAGLASSSQITQFLMARKRRASTPESTLLAEVANLNMEQVVKLEVRRVAQAASRVFALADAQFVCDSEAPTHDKGVITIEWVIFNGLRRHYDESRLIAELGALSGKHFQLADNADEQLPNFGFGHEGESVLAMLRGKPTTAKELVDDNKIDRQFLLSVLYSLWATELLAVEGDDVQPVRTSTTMPLQKAAEEAVAQVRAEQAALKQRTARQEQKAPPPPANAAPPPPAEAAPPPPAEAAPRDPAAPRRKVRPPPTIPMLAVHLAPETAEVADPGNKAVKVKRARVSPAELAKLVKKKLALLEKNASYYDLLGVKRGCGAGELQKAYFQLAKQLHPDRIHSAELDITDKVSQQLFARINRAFSTLTDPTKREHYHVVLEAGGELAYRRKQDADDRKAMNMIQAEEHFLIGEMAMRRGQYDTAVDQFEKAVELNAQEGEHLAYLGWAQWMAANDKNAAFEPARTLLNKGLELSPKCAPAHFFLGRLAKHKEDYQRALQLFEKTLKLAPGHKDAELEIRLMRGRGLI